MFQGLRRHSSWIIIVIAAVFIIGYAMMGVSGVFQKKVHLGEIAGKTITADAFQQYVENEYATYLQQNPDATIDENTEGQIVDSAWNKLVQSTVYDKEIKARKIKVSTEDILEKMKNPGDDIKSNPGFQTDGVFDEAKYKEILYSNEEFASMLEDYYRGSLPYEKLFEAVKAEATITEDEVREQYINQHNSADAQIIFFDMNKIDKFDITEEDELAYYNAHKEEYKKDPARKYKFVKIVNEASDADKNVVKARIDSLFEVAIYSGIPFEDIAREYSEDGSAAKGGDLGWFTKNRMVPEFAEKAFSMKVGDISLPVRTQFGWHIIKVLGIRTNDAGEKEVHASHILLKEEPSTITKEHLAILAQDVYDRAEEVGLEKAAEELGYQVEETMEFYESSQYPNNMYKIEGMTQFAFTHKVGTLHEVVEDHKGNFLIPEVSYKVGEHYQPFEDLKKRIHNLAQREKQVKAVIEKAEAFISANTPDNYMAAASKEGWEIVEATDVKFNSSIPRIRRVDELNNAMLEKEEGEFTSLIKDDKGAYIAYITKRTKPDMEKFEAEKESLMKAAQEKAETDHLNEWYRDIMEKANIVDNRSQFGY